MRLWQTEASCRVRISLVALSMAALTAASALAQHRRSGRVTRPARPAAQAPITRKIEFLRDVAPILDRNSCSTAQCHGKFGGRGGFQLSLLTLSPEDDYDPIVYGARGRRVNFAAPDQSLLLLKATAQIPHAGGPRFSVGSRDYRVLLAWLKQGAPFEAVDPRLASLKIEPGKSTLTRAGQKQPLRVIATFTDGSRREVTGDTVYQATNDAVLEVTDRGVVTAKRWGGGAVIGRYLGTVAAAFFTIPQPRKGPWPNVAVSGRIDRLVFDNLRRMNILPSALSTDEEFLRRVTLDTLGRLPYPEEIQAFVADRAADKRAKLIDALLEKPEYADFRAMRLADLLRVNPRKFANNGTLGSRAAALYYEWIWKSVAQNKPWDHFVRELVTARGSTFQNGPACFYRVETAPNDRMENISQAFLGVRMSCARCHKHPFDRWTTDDYWNFAAFPAKLQLRGGRLLDESIVTYVPDARLRNQSVTGRNRGKVVHATFLGEKQPAPDAPDMSAELADWMTNPRNPFFARATVNRLWSYYFGRGVIHPVDDMRATTPESVPGLLDALAGELVRSKWDVKAVIRLILNSRAYQLSSVPNASNRQDDQFFSHCMPRPMPAQALLDMVNQAAGVTEQFGAFPDRTRAVQAAIPPGNQFLNAFGVSHREFLADIDPKLEPNLVQTLMMINSPYLDGKVRSGRTVAEAVKATETTDDLIRALYLRTFSRQPSASEVARARALLESPLPAPSAAGNTHPPAIGKPASNPWPALTAPPKPAPVPNLAQLRRDRAQDLLWALITSREFFFNH